MSEKPNYSANYSKELKEKAAELGVGVPTVLLPKNIDVDTWAVIACDQHTQSPEYWDKVDYRVGKAPSTLRITLPEIFLNKSDTACRIKAIKSQIKSYLEQGLFNKYTGFVLVKRVTKSGTRRGIIFLLDLETYDYKADSKSLTKASELVIEERIPPRVAIRADAALEAPHIMLLFNDELDAVINSANAFIDGKAPLYSGNLMMGGGSIEGFLIDSEKAVATILDALDALRKKDSNSPLFLVGDGNHSLATAKKVWEDYKACHKGTVDHPLRYALVEAVNLYDDALKFSAIHRVLFQCNAQKFLQFFEWEFGSTVAPISTFDILCACVKNNPNSFGIGYCCDGEIHYFLLDTLGTNGTNPYKATPPLQSKKLIIKKVDKALERFLLTQKSAKVDYIHDEKELRALVLADRDGSITCTTICLVLPPIDKASLFPTVASDGSLPRKSFSMGDASEKRYYMEVRSLVE